MLYKMWVLLAISLCQVICQTPALGVRRKGLPWLSHFIAAHFRVMCTSGKQLVSAKLGLAEAATHFHSIRASLVLVPALLLLHRREVETPTLSCPWRCSGQAAGNELFGELFCCTF